MNLLANGFPWRTIVAMCMLPGQVVTTAGAETPCGSIGGTVDATQNCRVHETTPGFTFDAEFPVDYPDQQSLATFLVGQREQVDDYARKYPPRDRRKPYQLAVTATKYQSDKAGSGTESVVFEIEDDTGIANVARPATLYQTFTYDLGRHVPITFETLFTPATTPQDVQRHLATRGFAIPPQTGNGLHDFALIDGAVIFFLGHDSLHEDGPSEVTVPRAALKPLLA
jgi:hypothetical protein